MNPFQIETERVRLADRKSRVMMYAIHMYYGDPDVLRERLKAATTAEEVDEIFHAWAEQARSEVPK